MKELREVYFSMQTTLFQVPEEEKIELSGKRKEFVAYMSVTEFES